MKVACFQKKVRNRINLDLSRQIMTAEKSNSGKYHKKWRDETWAKRREMVENRIENNRSGASIVRDQVSN
jgi:hypothetical protein